MRPPSANKSRPPSRGGRPPSARKDRPQSGRKQNLETEEDIWKPPSRVTDTFNSSFIAADYAIRGIEEQYANHCRNKRIAEIAVPDASVYAMEVGHRTAFLKKINRE